VSVKALSVIEKVTLEISASSPLPDSSRWPLSSLRGAKCYEPVPISFLNQYTALGSPNPTRSRAAGRCSRMTRRVASLSRRLTASDSSECRRSPAELQAGVVVGHDHVKEQYEPTLGNPAPGTDSALESDGSGSLCRVFAIRLPHDTPYCITCASDTYL